MNRTEGLPDKWRHDRHKSLAWKPAKQSEVEARRAVVPAVEWTILRCRWMIPLLQPPSKSLMGAEWWWWWWWRDWHGKTRRNWADDGSKYLLNLVDRCSLCKGPVGTFRHSGRFLYRHDSGQQLLSRKEAESSFLFERLDKRGSKFPVWWALCWVDTVERGKSFSYTQSILERTGTECKDLIQRSASPSDLPLWRCRWLDIHGNADNIHPVWEAAIAVPRFRLRDTSMLLSTSASTQSRRHLDKPKPWRRKTNNLLLRHNWAT